MYDYLGTTVFVSVIAFAAFFLALSMVAAQLPALIHPAQRPSAVFVIVVTVLAAPIVLSPLTVGLFSIAQRMFRHDDPSVKVGLRGARELIGGSFALGYVQTIVAVVLISDAAFLLTLKPFAAKATGILAAYAFICWAMMAIYQWALLVEQKKSLRLTLYRSFLLTVANPGYTFVSAAFSGILLLGFLRLLFMWRYGVALMVPVSMFYGSLLPCLHTSATLEILRKYDDVVA